MLILKNLLRLLKLSQSSKTCSKKSGGKMANQKIALVIDDEQEVVDLVKDLLKDELHFLVLTATDPTVAADLAQSYVFDLLILDLHMPKLDGFQVLDIVRRKQPAIKVMIITGLYEQYKDR